MRSNRSDLYDDETDSLGAVAAEQARAPLPAIEAQARLLFARKVYRRARAPEAVFNSDTGKMLPTVREDCGVDPPKPCLPARLHSWSHVYTLCMRACRGEDVPPDIAKYRDELWPEIHAKFYTEKVDEALKAESDKFSRTAAREARRAKALAEMAVRESREARIKAAQERIVSYDAKLAKYAAKVKALETRKKRAMRSLRALKRYEEKEKTP